MNFFKNARSDFLHNPLELQRAALPCWSEPAMRLPLQTEAPNENIVQNYLNITLLNVFYYANSRYRYIFILYKFFICSDFLAESLVIRKF